MVSAPEESIKPQNQIHSDHPQTKGIILHFHRWPNDAEEKTIKDWARQVGLKMQPKKFKRFTVWAFEWKDINKSTTEKSACKSFPNNSLIKSCEPDYKATFNETEK